MFGLSFAETAIILLVAIVAIGPKELPTVIRAVMRTLGQIRAIGQEFRKNFDELAEEAELTKLRDDLMTPLPTIIDLEGNEQPTYDISGELAQDAKNRRKQRSEHMTEEAAPSAKTPVIEKTPAASIAPTTAAMASSAEEDTHG